jgi:hypothetical protein
LQPHRESLGTKKSDREEKNQPSREEKRKDRFPELTYHWLILFVWFVWSIWFAWLNWTNLMNETNEPDQPRFACLVPDPYPAGIELGRESVEVDMAT